MMTGEPGARRPPRRFRLDLPTHLIQSLRVTHAVMELPFDVSVPSEEAFKYEYLSGYFDLSFSIGGREVPALPGVEISHERPATRVGTAERPLIFPHGVIERCRRKWDATRPIRVLFVGLLTQPRARALREWLERVLGPAGPGGLRELSRRAESELGVKIVASTRGREFPVKAWDDDYFDSLGRTEFVLCPSGDYAWTYRFFEAAMCGAVPIVEQPCPLYAGFEYRGMDEPFETTSWSPGAAARNFSRVSEMLTVPKAELQPAVEELLHWGNHR